MTPQEHLKEVEENLNLAGRSVDPQEVLLNLAFAQAHAQAGMLAQAVQDSENMGQINATAQAARTELLRRSGASS